MYVHILDIMAALNVKELILAVTIIGLAAIALAAVAPIVVQSASSTADVMTETAGGGEQGSSTNNTSTNTTLNNINSSNAVLGSLFLTGEDRLTSFNRINESYTEISYVGNRTILPTEGVTTEMMNATETGNLTLKLQPNGITIIEGQSILVTKGRVGGNNSSGTEQQENATAILIDLNGVRPDDPRSSTGVAFLAQTLLAS
jgi:hypothetical protein